MSLKTWKKEYYSSPAAPRCRWPQQGMSQLEAAKLSLKKWKGLRGANLMEHNCTLGGGVLYGGRGSEFDLSALNCHLCAVNDLECDQCVLSKVRGGVRCSNQMTKEVDSPWMAMVKDNDVEPMIFWLKKAVKYAEENDL